jgi:hypothetical protein
MMATSRAPRRVPHLPPRPVVDADPDPHGAWRALCRATDEHVVRMPDLSAAAEALHLPASAGIGIIRDLFAHHISGDAGAVLWVVTAAVESGTFRVTGAIDARFLFYIVEPHMSMSLNSPKPHVASICFKCFRCFRGIL